MKKTTKIIALTLVGFFIVSCGVRIEKRRYTKGFHVSSRSGIKTSKRSDKMETAINSKNLIVLKTDNLNPKKTNSVETVVPNTNSLAALNDDKRVDLSSSTKHKRKKSIDKIATSQFGLAVSKSFENTVNTQLDSPIAHLEASTIDTHDSGISSATAHERKADPNNIKASISAVIFLYILLGIPLTFVVFFLAFSGWFGAIGLLSIPIGIGLLFLFNWGMVKWLSSLKRKLDKAQG